MAQLLKRLALPVGTYFKNDADREANKPTYDYRDIGVLMEHTDGRGNTWQEIKLNLDVLNPVLAGMVLRLIDKGQSTTRVKLFDLRAKSQKPSTGRGTDADADDDRTDADADDDIPF